MGTLVQSFTQEIISFEGEMHDSINFVEKIIFQKHLAYQILRTNYFIITGLLNLYQYPYNGSISEDCGRMDMPPAKNGNYLSEKTLQREGVFKNSDKLAGSRIIVGPAKMSDMICIHKIWLWCGPALQILTEKELKGFLAIYWGARA